MLTAMMRAFMADEAGATAIEYALLGTLIAIAIISTFVALGDGVQGLFNNGTSSTLTNQSAKIR